MHKLTCGTWVFLRAGPVVLPGGARHAAHYLCRDGVWEDDGHYWYGCVSAPDKMAHYLHAWLMRVHANYLHAWQMGMHGNHVH
jgi:hypothetical protein